MVAGKHGARHAHLRGQRKLKPGQIRLHGLSLGLFAALCSSVGPALAQTAALHPDPAMNQGPGIQPSPPALMLMASADQATTPKPTAEPLPQARPWAQLTSQWQSLLAPLAREWDQLPGDQQQRWLGVAERYPQLSAERQARLRQRISEWAQLTPLQRQQVRESWRRLRDASPSERAEFRKQWQSWKSLPSEERERLRRDARDKPAATPHGSLAAPSQP